MIFTGSAYGRAFFYTQIFDVMRNTSYSLDTNEAADTVEVRRDERRAERLK